METKGRVRWLLGAGAAVIAMGALWCCRRAMVDESRAELEAVVAESRGGEEAAEPGQNGHSEGTQSAQTDSRSALLGTNLPPVGYGHRYVPFVDLMRSADAFHSGTAERWRDGRRLRLRDDGYPERLARGQIARTFLIASEDPHFAGEVVVLYEGKGRLGYLGGVSRVERGEGRDVVHLGNRGGLWVEIDQTDPADPLRAIRVLAPGGRCEGDPSAACTGDRECGGRCVPFEESYREQPFHPTFLADLKPFGVLRFMNWMRVNRVRGEDEARPDWPVKEWEQYPEVASRHWKTVPVPVMVQLANTLGAAPWFTMPHQANDDFVRRFAERVKRELEPERTIYVELSNEAWNDIFRQSQEINALGCEAYAERPERECDDDQDGELCEYGEWNATQARCVEYGRRWFARRTAEIGAIWNDVFAGDERVVNVLGMQVGSLRERGEAMLNLEVDGLGAVHRHVDAVAVAPYFGGGAPPENVDAAFRKVDLPGGDETYAVLVGAGEEGGPLQWIVRDRRALRAWPELRLIAYEGGQHFVALGDSARGEVLAAINRDPRMGQVYDEYLQRWAALTGGALFVHYRSPSAWSEWGYWGSKEYQGQPVEEAPKHGALLRYVGR